MAEGAGEGQLQDNRTESVPSWLVRIYEGPIDRVLAAIGTLVFLAGWGAIIYVTAFPRDDFVLNAGGAQGKVISVISYGASVTIASAVIWIAAGIIRGQRQRTS